MDNHAVRVQGLHKRFGDIQAVQGVSFDIAEGEIFSLLGPNGAGKSTTISMLSCLLEPTPAWYAALKSIARRSSIMEQNGKSWRPAMHTASGMAIGAAFGLLFGLMLLETVVAGPLVGAVVGALLGWISDIQRRR